MTVYRDDAAVDVGQLADLRGRCGFTPRPAAELAQQVAGARWVVSAWDGDSLIGFARAISDGVTNAYVSSVMVDEAWRRCGVGRELMRRLMAGGGAEMRWVLHARVEAMDFYRSLGFTEASDMMWAGRVPTPPRTGRV